MGFESVMVATREHEDPHLFGTNKGLEYIVQPHVMESFRKSVFGMFMSLPLSLNSLTIFNNTSYYIGGSDPGSCFLFCQIPVSRLHYVHKQFSFFVISWVLLDIIFRFHDTII